MEAFGQVSRNWIFPLICIELEIGFYFEQSFCSHPCLYFAVVLHFSAESSQFGVIMMLVIAFVSNYSVKVMVKAKNILQSEGKVWNSVYLLCFNLISRAALQELY
jgi:hypothetical protein